MNTIKQKDSVVDSVKKHSASAPARYLPFAVFMAFIGIEELLRAAAEKGYLPLSSESLLYLYPIKILVVVGILYSFRKEYNELVWRDLLNLKFSIAALLSGIAVFLLWINLDWAQPSIAGHGYNPLLLPLSAQPYMIALRIFGAVIVVPIMEELFWRSFLLRYITDTNFHKVQLGRFTWPSFLITVVLFGFEHHLILAGMVAGIIYNMVIYRTKSLAQCVFAHAVTNAALAIFVLVYQRWDLW